MSAIKLLSISLGMLIAHHLIKPGHRWSFVIDDRALIVWISLFLLYTTHTLPTIWQNILVYFSIGNIITVIFNIFFDTTNDHQNQKYTKFIVISSLMMILSGMILSMFSK